VSGSDISWAICKSAPRSRQIATPAPHHSVFYRPDALPAAEPTASKHWRHFLRPNVYEKKFTGFCQVLKKMHAKENWLLFFCVTSRCRAWLTVYGEFGLSLVPANGVLCPTYVDAVVRCPSTIDLETSIIQDRRPAQGQRGIFFVGADARGRGGRQYAGTSASAAVAVATMTAESLCARIVRSYSPGGATHASLPRHSEWSLGRRVRGRSSKQYLRSRISDLHGSTTQSINQWADFL